jgi:phosphoenolpyruvate carboxykinase (GTP)
MLPFCGYNMADHWQHWLDVGKTLRTSAKVPRIFQVNWFRTAEDGSFLWPGFGENARVLEWIQGRVDGQIGARETPLGYVPTDTGLNVEGLDDVDLEQLFAIDRDAWLAESDDTETFFGTFGRKVPAELYGQLETLRDKLRSYN